MGLIYRRAGLEEIDALTKTRIEVLRAANGLDGAADMREVERQSYDYYCRTLRDSTHTAYLVFDDARIAGSGGISFFQVMPTYHNPSGKKAYIMNMYTIPAYRRRGIAYQTLLVGEAARRGITAVSLEATPMGRPLYEAFGFVSMRNEMELPLDALPAV